MSGKGGLGRVVFIAIGVAALCVAVWQGVATASFLRNAVRVQGHVVPDSPGSTRKVSAGHPMVAFTDARGKSVRYRQNGMGSTPIGQRVDLLYSPSDPAGTATVGGLWGLWGSTILPLIMGLGFLIVSFIPGVEIGGRPGRF